MSFNALQLGIRDKFRLGGARSKLDGRSSAQGLDDFSERHFLTRPWRAAPKVCELCLRRVPLRFRLYWTLKGGLFLIILCFDTRGYACVWSGEYVLGLFFFLQVMVCEGKKKTFPGNSVLMLKVFIVRFC